MEDYQRENIRELKLKGLSNRKIANELNLNLNVVNNISNSLLKDYNKGLLLQSHNNKELGINEEVKTLRQSFTELKELYIALRGELNNISINLDKTTEQIEYSFNSRIKSFFSSIDERIRDLIKEEIKQEVRK